MKFGRVRKMRICLWLMLIMTSAFFVCAGECEGAVEDRILKSWTKSQSRSERDGMQSVNVKVTYYSAEYVEALIRAEAEKNLWTRDEEERYRYNLLRTLNLEENIAFHVEFDTTGTPVYLQPFDRHLKLYVGKKVLSPAEYDKRFNFKLQGKRDGMIWFSRFDEKTGKNQMDGIKQLRLFMSGSMSTATTSGGDLIFVWDITRDDPSVLNKGTAADRLEMDRLIKRLEKLNTDRAGFQKQLDAIDTELSELTSRVEEIQRH
ncbi:hypothetical protein FACS1894187_00580 [Synergistales bacterium]|nr:hypothetical protein FACS1894187_00580 [Synergistales bacterium]